MDCEISCIPSVAKAESDNYVVVTQQIFHQFSKIKKRTLLVKGKESFGSERPLGCPRRGREDNIKTNLQAIGWGVRTGLI